MAELLRQIRNGEAYKNIQPTNLHKVYVIISRQTPTGERAFRLLPPYLQIDGLTKNQFDNLKNDAIKVGNKKQPQSELTTLTGYQKEIKAQLAKIVAEVNSSTTPQPAPAISNIYV